MQALVVNITAWLRNLGLERYEQASLEHGIRADALPDLTEPDLERLGIYLGDRKRSSRRLRRGEIRPCARPKVPECEDFQYDVSFNPRRRR